LDDAETSCHYNSVSNRRGFGRNIRHLEDTTAAFESPRKRDYGEPFNKLSKFADHSIKAQKQGKLASMNRFQG